MWPRHSGFGVTSSPLVENLCGLVGIKDITVKLNGRRRKIDNVVKAWLRAVTTMDGRVPSGGNGKSRRISPRVTWT